MFENLWGGIEYERVGQLDDLNFSTIGIYKKSIEKKSFIVLASQDTPCAPHRFEMMLDPKQKLAIKRIVAIKKRAASELLKNMNRTAAYENLFETLW